LPGPLALTQINASTGALVTAELIRRHEQELAWLAELGELAAQPDPEIGP
jgi:hypothetical protein